MAIEVGSAYLSIGASTSGMGKDIKKAFGDAERGAGSAGGKIGGSLTKGIIGKIGVAGAAIGAALGLGSLVKEAVDASDAVDKFKQTLSFAKLDSSRIDQLTASTKKYADETVYSLGDIQSITAQLAANSVKDYDKLAEAAGNLNAVAGGNADTFKSVGMVLTQTAGQGKLTTENWNQLSDAIPGASGMLQEALAKASAYTGNFRDAMAKGEITAEEFNAALLDLGMSDVAKEAATSTKTFEGAWGNLQATIVSGLMGMVDKVKEPITSAMATASELIGKGFAKIEEYGPSVGSALSSAFKNIQPILAPLGAAFGQIWTAVQPLVPQIMTLMTAFSPLSMVLKALTPVIPTLAASLGQIGQILAGVLGQALAIVTPMISQLTTLLGQTFVKIMPVVQQAIGAVGQILQSLAPVVMQVVGVVAQLVTSLASSLLPVIASLVSSILPPVISIVQSIVKVIGPLVEVILAVLIPAIDALLPVVDLVFKGAGKIIEVAVKVIAKAIAIVTDIVVGMAGSMKANIETAKNSFKTGFNVIKTIVTGVFNHIKIVIKTAMGVIQGIIKTVTSLIKGDWSGAWDGIKQIFSSVIDGIGNIARNAISTLTNVGKMIIDGFWNGIKGGFGKIQDGLSWLTNKLTDWKGPAKKDKTLLTPAGVKVISGFAKGLESGYDGVRSSLKAFTADIAGVQTNAVKAETKRIQEAIRVQNQQITKTNKKLADKRAKAIKSAAAKRDKALAAADKIKDSKAKAAAKKAAQSAYKIDVAAAKKKYKAQDKVQVKTAAQAEKQAKKNLGVTKAATKAANKLIAAQEKKTSAVWAGGKYKGSVQRWQGMSLGTARILTDISSAGNFKKDARSSVKKITLADVGKAQGEVTAALAKAKETVAQMREARAQLKESVASSIKGELDLTAGIGQDTVDATGHTIKGKTNFASVAGTVKAMAAKAKTFAQRLASLTRAGLPPGLVQEVAGLGTENGIKVADAFLEGSPSQIKSLSADYAAVTSWSSKAGDYVAGQMYDTGINAQEGLIKGLEADSAKLAAAAKKLADKLTTSVKKALGIKSPSRVFRFQIGEMVVAGLQKGLQNDNPATHAAEDLAIGIQRPFDAVNVNSWKPPTSALSASYSATGSERMSDEEFIERLVDAMQSAKFVAKYAPNDREVAGLVQRGQTAMRRL